MPSSLQDTNVSDLDWENMPIDSLRDLATNDDRQSVKSKATDLLAERDRVQLKSIEDYNPRVDLGPERYEDKLAREEFNARDFIPVEGQIEVPLEESRRDETTVLSTDFFDSEGNRIT